MINANNALKIIVIGCLNGKTMGKSYKSCRLGSVISIVYYTYLAFVNSTVAMLWIFDL